MEEEGIWRNEQPFSWGPNPQCRGNVFEHVIKITHYFSVFWTLGATENCNRSLVSCPWRLTLTLKWCSLLASWSERCDTTNCFLFVTVSHKPMRMLTVNLLLQEQSYRGGTGRWRYMCRTWALAKAPRPTTAVRLNDVNDCVSKYGTLTSRKDFLSSPLHSTSAEHDRYRSDLSTQ